MVSTSQKTYQVQNGMVIKQLGPSCRFCSTTLQYTFVDLGMSPLCESYLTEHQLNQMEPFYPLHVHICEKCFLVQLQQYVSPQEIFSEYAYFSSYSDTWLRHAKVYTETVVKRFGLGAKSQVVEIGSNDGYLLQYFAARSIPTLGIEPAANVAKTAVRKGIRTIVEFFGADLARKLTDQGIKADLLIGNNTLAQIPDLNDFVAGIRILLKPQGIITMEFPHLLRLMQGNQFDTIYHEHFSYFSLLAVEKIFAAHGLKIFDVDELSTHGGSLRIYAGSEDTSPAIGKSIEGLRAKEKMAGLHQLENYSYFAERVKETKRTLLEFLIRAKREGKTIVGYGAPGKGNTLLNYCGIGSDFLDYTVDRSPYKQGKYLPGTHIPILHPEQISRTKPDYLLILPWNLSDEIMEQVSYIRKWGGQFVVPIPEAKVLS